MRVFDETTCRLLVLVPKRRARCPYSRSMRVPCMVPCPLCNACRPIGQALTLESLDAMSLILVRSPRTVPLYPRATRGHLSLQGHLAVPYLWWLPTIGARRALPSRTEDRWIILYPNGTQIAHSRNRNAEGIRRLQPPVHRVDQGGSWLALRLSFIWFHAVLCGTATGASLGRASDWSPYMHDVASRGAAGSGRHIRAWDDRGRRTRTLQSRP